MIGERVVRSYDSGWKASWIAGPSLQQLRSDVIQEYEQRIASAADQIKATVFQIAAERNVTPESETTPAVVEPNGSGLTNLIRGFLYDSRYKMYEVEEGLRSDLNEIYAGDTYFTRILSRRDPDGQWEVYLTDAEGATVRLSQSGSSLKSIFIILATIRLNPLIGAEHSLQNNVFCVEEPENNLHPALLRRLLDFLSRAREVSNSSLVITTHSSAAIDWATRRVDSTTYHIRRTPVGSTAQQAREYIPLRFLLEDLDIRASELLQSNGVVWVEGPSDRIYLRRWVSLASNAALKEGVHYSIMFYGGKLLSRLSSLPPDEAEEAVSLLRLNRNAAIVIDSDKRRLKNGRFRSNLNDTKKRLIAETLSVGGEVWVTAGKEIENYLSDEMIRNLLDSSITVGKYDSVPDALRGIGDKVSIAHRVASLLKDEDLDVLDLRARIAGLVTAIRRWNAL